MTDVSSLAEEQLEEQLYALGLLEGPAAARVARRLQEQGAAGWDALERQLASEAQVRELLAASGVSLRADTLALLAHLQALRERLRLLRSIAETTEAIGRKAADRNGAAT